MNTRAVLLIFGVVLSAILFYGAPAVFQFYQNRALSTSVKPDKVEWTVQAINDEEFRPKAHFSYTVNGKSYEKDELFQGVKYRNPFAAKDDLKNLSLEYPLVWYASKYPEKSSLEKYFPAKRAIYSGMLFALFFYAVWLFRYWERHH